MDEAQEYNKRRWSGLVEARALFTRPWMEMTVESARDRIDRWEMLGDVTGKRVLCLAGGGGQQSAAFALLGANVSVLDLCEGQLKTDRETAAHYGLEVETRPGDMRDLSVFEEDAFDIVWQPYSRNFVPDCRVVFREVARVLKVAGLYHFMAANPFACGMGTGDWNGEGYVVRRPYVEGALIEYADESWVCGEGKKPSDRISGPREYRQTLGRLVNGLIACGLTMVRMEEWAAHDQNLEAEEGEWEHFTSRLPPWLWFWARSRSDGPQAPRS